jgi:hypothetical protein
MTVERTKRIKAGRRQRRLNRSVEAEDTERVIDARARVNMCRISLEYRKGLGC